MVFLIIFGVGLLLTIITFVIGELFDFGDWGDHGADVGDSPSPFSSRVLFVFMTAFGGFGFMAQAWDWPIAGAVLAALIGGAGVAGGTFFLIVLPMARQQGSVHLSLNDLVDLTGEVTDDIPEGGVGRVTIVPPGSGARVARPARSQTGGHLPAGTTVRVLNVGPGSVTVAPVDAFQGTPPPPRP